eukprot:TRINITY_DN5562_c0_g1_i1.p1 TRINITY_DN5562_c0_g1~~TRINITY_DN5562_c0_g1_i1.p1  ORF type:complete len:140 (+),score=3.58 TRINITY_DN5562_c0_g1_i1:3127-3546(+)
MHDKHKWCGTISHVGCLHVNGVKKKDPLEHVSALERFPWIMGFLFPCYIFLDFIFCSFSLSFGVVKISALKCVSDIYTWTVENCFIPHIQNLLSAKNASTSVHIFERILHGKWKWFEREYDSLTVYKHFMQFSFSFITV